MMSRVKRFLVFAGDNYYPIGGWNDFVGDCDTVEEAKALAEKASGVGRDWWQVLDTETQKLTES